MKQPIKFCCQDSQSESKLFFKLSTDLFVDKYSGATKKSTYKLINEKNQNL